MTWIIIGVALLVGAAIGYFASGSNSKSADTGGGSTDAACQANLKTCQEESARIQTSIETGQKQTGDIIKALLNCQAAHP